MEKDRKVWKRGFIGVLKDSPSKNRKLFRWKDIDRDHSHPSGDKVVESGELEVFPETSP